MQIKAFFVSAFLIVAGDATSQETVKSAAPHGAVVTGIAIDSVHRIPLIGASITVSGTGLTSKTDLAGEFRIAGIPNGPHSLTIQHPLLDSLAIAISTRQKVFKDGDSSFVMVGVPSAESLVNSTCTDDDRLSGPAFVVGTVTDADSGDPSAGASVIVRWTDYDIGTNSVKTTPKTRTAIVSESGRFRVCGLPRDLVASVFASRGDDSTAALKTDLSSLIGVLSFHLPPAKESSAGSSVNSSRHASASIAGRVVDTDGKSVSNASVSVESDDAAVLTDKDGNFTLNGLRPGTRWVVVRKIGHEPRRVAAELKSGQSTTVNLLLGNSVTLLKEVIVSAARDAGLRAVGFADRKRYQTGDFLGPRELERKDRHDLMPILKTSARFNRGGCTRYFVDGNIVMSGVDPNEYLGGSEIGAIEIYSEPFVPGEFLARTRNGVACKAVVVWTKGRLRI